MVGPDATEIVAEEAGAIGRGTKVRSARWGKMSITSKPTRRDTPRMLIETAMQCYREVEHIYGDAGAADRLELDLFEGGHRWGGNKSVEFFRRHLAPGGGA